MKRATQNSDNPSCKAISKNMKNATCHWPQYKHWRYKSTIKLLQVTEPLKNGYRTTNRNVQQWAGSIKHSRSGYQKIQDLNSEKLTHDIQQIKHHISQINNNITPCSCWTVVHLVNITNEYIHKEMLRLDINIPKVSAEY